jgi:hypothetical protein
MNSNSHELLSSFSDFLWPYSVFILNGLMNHIDVFIIISFILLVWYYWKEKFDISKYFDFVDITNFSS